MKCYITIPSKGRPYQQKTVDILRQTKLPEGWDWKVFVEPQEYRYYKQSVGKDKIEVLPENDKGLAYVANYANAYVKDLGHEIQWWMDDDVNLFIDKRAKSKYSAEVLGNICKRFPQCFEDEPELGLIRFMSARGYYHYKERDLLWIAKNQGGWGCYLVRTELFRQEPYWYTHGDTMQCIHVWEQGYYTKTTGLAGISVDMYDNEGGYQMFDRKALTIKTFEALQKEYPLMKFVESKNTLGYDIDTSMYRPKTEYY